MGASSIERWRQTKLSPGEMARRLGRHRSTIFRGLRRNHFHDSEVPKLSGYWCVAAQSSSEGRRTRQRKLVQDPGLRDHVERCLRSGWTPEQIAGRMRLEQHRIRVSHETIYRFAYSKLGVEEAFYRHLPEHRRRRRPRTHRRYQRSRIQDSQSLCHRPTVVAERQQFGN
ncbi:IS30 family transposase [Paracoccus sp. (in: a-proteobacteria)]|uniref:IS30 family transposase n=1 Tax=Paracoccus sp. TaxID=267 RepID=UPI0035AE033C